MFRTLLAASIALAFAFPAAAHSVDVGSLSLTDLWTRASPPKAPSGAGYLTVTNKGSDPDRLFSVSARGVDRTEIHQMAVVDGVMKMGPVEGGIEIPAGGSITLAPGGFHIMFIGLKEPLVEGGRMPVTLNFEKAGKVETFLHILAVGAGGPEGHDHGAGMKMDTTQ
ncbi:MAG: copper chaperone PCu(A)C [Bauldia sp.]